MRKQLSKEVQQGGAERARQPLKFLSSLLRPSRNLRALRVRMPVFRPPEFSCQPSTTGFVRQISCAYSAMVRSDEKAPMPATLRMALRVQASGSR